MINDTLNKWRGGSRTLLKNLFIGYLALVTGCSTTVQQVEQASAIEHSQATSYSYDDNAATGTQATDANPYNLPELASNTVKDDLPSSKTDALSEFVGGMPAAEQQAIANPLNGGYKGGDEFGSMAMGMLNSAATQELKEWFSARNATTEIAFNVGSKGTKSASFDMLYPIVDGKKDLVFAQVGVRHSNARTEDYRSTINLGVGYRRSFDNWLAGINGFYDRDMTGKNERLGIGAEAFTDNIRASANVYMRLSEWKQSPDLDYYLERPANGYDLRLEGNLPSMPKVTAKAVYEKYFGDQVGLFSAGNRQKDPQAVTLGLSYAPVPMISAGVDYRQGQGGLSETSVKLAVNYQFGVPLSKQLSTAYSVNHNLANSRYGLVNRNNEIVLDYKKAEHALLMLPAEVSGTPTAVVSFPVTLTGGHVSNVTWTGSASGFARPYNSSGTGSVVLPAYNPAGLNTYTLQAVATDVYGEVVKSNVMQVTVTPFLIALERSKAEAKADGSDEVTFTATLQEPSGLPRANTAIVWAVSGSANVVEKDSMTNKQGKANLKLVSRSSSAVRVSAKEPQGAAASANADFLGDPTSAKIVSLVATPATILANGTATSSLVATVIDKNGNFLGAGIPVTWTTSNGTLASASTVTDDESKATVVLTSPVQIGNAKVTAKAVAGSADANVDFVADIANAKVLALVAAPGVIPADGASTSQLTATIGDTHGNPVGAGVPVNWNTTDGTLSVATSVTDAASKAVVTLKSSTKMGAVTVTAKASAGEATAPVAFAANTATARVTGLVALPTSIPANNIATSSLEATVEDAHGNPVSGAPVAWTTSLGVLSSSSTTTDTSGKSVITLKGPVAGTATVNAQAVAGSAAAAVDLVPDNSTAKVVGLVASPGLIPANDTTTSTLEATVKDATGNLVPGVVVTWSTSLGTLSDASTTTDASGKTTVTLKGSVAGSAGVRAASVAGASTTTVTLTPDGSTAKVIGLIATPATIVANNSATSTLVATVEDAHGNAVPGAPVAWSSSLGTLSATSTTTDATGKATVTLKGDKSGTANIEATAAAGASTTAVILTPDGTTAKVVDLTATPSTITADGVSTSVLVATLKDANGNLVGAGSTVTWGTTRGYLAAASSITDASSRATVVLTSSTAAGTATVTATGAAGSANAQVVFIPDQATARVIGLVATPSSITADGVSQSVVVATVEDVRGNKMSAGAAVSWATSDGTLSAGTTYTDSNGKAQVTLTSSMAMGLATVTGTAAMGSAGTGVQFVANVNSAKVIALSASPTTIKANNVAVSTFVATVEDAGGNPMPAGVPVSWTTTNGTLASPSTVTDGRGKATVTLKGTTAGPATVTATAKAGSASAGIALVADTTTARVTSLTASPGTIVANGSSASTLTAVIRDAYGNNVGAGLIINWTTNRGLLSNSQSVTDAAGQTAIVLRGTAIGTATVTAAAVAGSANANVLLVADTSTARVVSMSASPTSLPADSTSVSYLTAYVRDAYNNPVAGLGISWGTNLGWLSAGSSVTDANGATTVATASGTAGTATATAYAPAGAGNVNVTFIAINPVINSFSVSTTVRGKLYPNAFVFDSGAGNMTYSPVFSWSVAGATRYELVDADGEVQYSGTAASYTYGQNQSWTRPYFTLRAYNGAAVTTMVIYPDFQDVFCGSCGTGS